MNGPKDPAAALLSPEGISDPYPIYDQIREQAPVVWSDALKSWLIVSHEHAREAYRDYERFSSVGINVHGKLDSMPESVKSRAPLVSAVEGSQVLNTADPPVHTRHRRFLNRPLSRRSLHDQAEWIRSICNALVAQMETRSSEPIDLIQDFTTKLSYEVILGLFGSPTEHVPLYQQVAEAFFSYHAEGSTEREVLEYEDALGGLKEALEGLYDDLRAAEEQDTILSSLLHPMPDADALSDEELFVLSRKFFAGGHENLIYTIAIAIMELARNPDQMKLLREDPTLSTNAYEEAVRWEPPNQGNPRIATVDDPFGMGKIRAGDRVLIMKAAAARDPEAWTRPNIFDITRDTNEPPGGSIAFGQGPHFCVGASLAREVGPTAIQILLDRFDSISLPTGWIPKWELAPLRRKLESLPLVLN